MSRRGLAYRVERARLDLRLARRHVADAVRALPTKHSPIIVTIRVRRGRITREEWLGHAVDALAPVLAEVRLDGRRVAFPPRTRVSVGFGGLTARYEHGCAGVCFPSDAAVDGQPQIFISPTVDDEVEILVTLLHELMHAADDCEHGHGGWFGRLHRAVGFEGKPSEGPPGAALKTTLVEIATRLMREHGRYPHSALRTSS